MTRRNALALALLPAVAVAWSVPVSRSYFECAACRLGRRDHSWLGLTWSRLHPNDCSRRYPEVVEPRHDHAWIRHSCTRLMSVFGGTWGFACGPGLGPLYSLSPELQASIYEHFEDSLEAKRLFLELADDRRGETRDDDRRTALALHEWALAGFPGTWGEWREAHLDGAGDDLDAGGPSVPQ